jgi:hypothetical protein
MAKKTVEESPKQILEIPEKAGFGTKNCYIATETLEQRITYTKYGKGDEEIIWALQDIQKADPEAKVEKEDNKIVINLSKPFSVRTFKAPRKVSELSERDKNRLKGVIGAIVNSESPENEELSDEEFEQRVSKFPKVVGYYTDNEEEDYYIKSEEEIWIYEGYFKNNADLLLTLTEAYLKSKGIEKSSEKYLEKFENIVAWYI